MSACAYSEIIMTTKEEYQQLKKEQADSERPTIGKSIVDDGAYDAYPDEDEHTIVKVPLSKQDIEELKSGVKFLTLTTTAHYSH